MKGVAAEKELEKYRTTVQYSKGSSNLKLFAFILIIIVAVGVIGYVAFAPHGQTSATVKGGSGSMAPNFTLPDTNGGTFTLSDYRGKSNVLIFFNEGLSCQPCLQQMQDLDGAYTQFSGLNVVVVSITTDPINDLANWANSAGVKHSKVLSDQNLEVSKVYGMLGSDVSMMPGTRDGHSFVLVDTSGIIKWRQDYAPNTMYVPNDQIIAAVRRALGA